MSGGIYYSLSCDWCGVDAGNRRYERRRDALDERTRVSTHEGWLLKRPRGVDVVLLCPECVAAGH